MTLVFGLGILSGCGGAGQSGGISGSNPTVDTSGISSGVGGSSGAVQNFGTGTVALIYSGTGVCSEDCADAAAESARLAGLTPKLVTGSALANAATDAQVADFFKDVAVWVEPGGYATNSYQGMTTKLRTALKTFIQSGGGYVGFCAGAFMATSIIGSTGVSGLGVFPGKTYPYNGSTTEIVNWSGQTQSVYWEGGPYFYNYDSSVEPIAYYSNGTTAAARTTFGSGRVYLSGPHPEAPDWWSGKGSSSSIAGGQQWIAANMIKWAAHLE